MSTLFLNQHLFKVPGWVEARYQMEPFSNTHYLSHLVPTCPSFDMFSLPPLLVIAFISAALPNSRVAGCGQLDSKIGLNY